MSDHSISCRSRHVAEEPGPTCLARERGRSVVTDHGGGVTRASAQPQELEGLPHAA